MLIIKDTREADTGSMYIHKYVQENYIGDHRHKQRIPLNARDM